MALYNKNQRGTLGADSFQAMTSQPVPLPRTSVMTGLRGADDASRMTQDMGHGKEPSSPMENGQAKVFNAGDGNRSHKNNKAMVDSHLTSFNSGGIGIGSPRVEDYEDDDDNDDVFDNNDVRASQPSEEPHPFRPHSKGRAPAVPPPVNPQHPGSIPSKNKPPFQNLADLPGLSIVTWEEFVDNPSVLCGLFETDRQDYIHYNSEQVNVFFHDSRMEQPTLGAPSGDGLSWTVFIDSYNHLRSVRSWLTERVSVILLQLLRPQGQGKAACVVAINPKNKSVGEDLHSTFTQAVDAFLHQRNFSVELNLNGCVKTWCRTVLEMPCGVRGGRLVVTNGDECVPCTRVFNYPFCVFCFPVWGCQKLAYRFKRRSDYEDFFLYFKAEDLALCTKSKKLMEYAEKNNNTTNNNNKMKKGNKKTPGGANPPPWIRKNRQSVTSGTQTLESEDDMHNRAGLTVEEVEDAEDGGWQMQGSSRDHGRGKPDSGFSSASTSMERIEPQTSSTGTPSYRPLHSIPPARPKDRTQVHRSQNQTSASKNNLFHPTQSPPSSSSYASTGGLSPRGGGGVRPAHDPTSSSSWQVLQSVGEDDDDDDGHGDGDGSLNLQTPRTPRSAREDPRSIAGYDPVSTFPSVGSDDEHGGSYRLLAETPSPRPDTPFNKRLSTPSLKARRPGALSETAVTEDCGGGGENGDGTPPEDRMRLKGGTASLLPEPASKQRKKRISKVLRDMSGPQQYVSWQHPVVAGDETNLRNEEGGLYARDNQAFVAAEEEGELDASFKQPKNAEKVKYTPIKGLKDKNSGSSGGPFKAFPYTSELLDFIGENNKNKTSYSLVDPDATRGDEVKIKKKKKSAVQRKAEDMLFAPRFKLGDDRQDRNCLSDNDIGPDEDMTDMEPDSVMSDVEGVASPRLIPVKRSERIIAVSALAKKAPPPPRSGGGDGGDTDEWELTDCELDEDSRRLDGPKVLAGARGAAQLRATSAQRARGELPGGGVGAEGRRRGGVQNDSRRRYIALNSLRRKANQLALQADLRKQKRPESANSSAMEVMEV